jgi:hypothetical protein
MLTNLIQVNHNGEWGTVCGHAFQDARYSVYLLYWYKSTNTDTQKREPARELSVSNSTCFTGTKVTCFTGTKVQILTRRSGSQRESCLCATQLALLVQKLLALLVQQYKYWRAEAGASAKVVCKQLKCVGGKAQKMFGGGRCQLLYFCTQFTCFNGRKVQILTPEVAAAADASGWRRRPAIYSTKLLALLVQRYKSWHLRWRRQRTHLDGEGDLLYIVQNYLLY